MLINRCDLFFAGQGTVPPWRSGSGQSPGSSPQSRLAHSANLAPLQPLPACNMDSSPAGFSPIPRESPGAGTKGAPAWRLAGLDDLAELSLSASPPRHSLNAQKELFELEMQTPTQPSATPRLFGSGVLHANSASSAAVSAHPASEPRTSWSDWSGAEETGTSQTFNGSSLQQRAQQATLPWVERASEDAVGKGPASDAWADWAAAGHLTAKASPGGQSAQQPSAQLLQPQQRATSLLDL